MDNTISDPPVIPLERTPAEMWRIADAVRAAALTAYPVPASVQTRAAEQAIQEELAALARRPSLGEATAAVYLAGLAHPS